MSQSYNSLPKISEATTKFHVDDLLVRRRDPPKTDYVNIKAKGFLTQIQTFDAPEIIEHLTDAIREEAGRSFLTVKAQSTLSKSSSKFKRSVPASLHHSSHKREARNSQASLKESVRARLNPNSPTAMQQPTNFKSFKSNSPFSTQSAFFRGLQPTKNISQDRFDILELSNWIGTHLSEMKNAASLTIHDILDYKQNVLNIGLSHVMAYVDSSCKEIGTVLRLIWDTTFSIFENLLKALTEHSSHQRIDKLKSEQQLHKLHEINLSFLKQKNAQIEAEVNTIYERMKNVIIWNRRLRKDRHRLIIQNKIQEYQNQTYFEALEEVIELLLVSVNNGQVLPVARKILLKLDRDRRNKKRPTIDFKHADEEFKQNAKEVVYSWLRRNALDGDDQLLRSQLPPMGKLTQQEELALFEREDRQNVEAVDIYEFFKMIDVGVGEALRTSTKESQYDFVLTVKSKQTNTTQVSFYDKSIQTENEKCDNNEASTKGKKPGTGARNQVKGKQINEEHLRGSPGSRLNKRNSKNIEADLAGNERKGSGHDQRGAGSSRLSPNPNFSNGKLKRLSKVDNMQIPSHQKVPSNDVGGRKTTQEDYNKRADKHGRGDQEANHRRGEQNRGSYPKGGNNLNGNYNGIARVSVGQIKNSTKSFGENDSNKQFECQSQKFKRRVSINPGEGSETNRGHLASHSKISQSQSSQEGFEKKRKQKHRNQHVHVNSRDYQQSGQFQRRRSLNFIREPAVKRFSKLIKAPFEQIYEQQLQQIKQDQSGFIKNIIRRRSFYKKSALFDDYTLAEASCQKRMNLFQRKYEFKVDHSNCKKMVATMNEKIQRFAKKLPVSSNIAKKKVVLSYKSVFSSVLKSLEGFKREPPKNRSFLNTSLQAIHRYIWPLVHDYVKQIRRERDGILIDCEKTLYSLQVLLIEKMNFSYGLKDIADKKIKDFFEKILTFAEVSQKVGLYALLLGLEREDVGADELMLYLRCWVYLEPKSVLQKDFATVERTPTDIATIEQFLQPAIEPILGAATAFARKTEILESCLRNSTSALSIELVALALIEDLQRQRKSSVNLFMKIYRTCSAQGNFFLNYYKLLKMLESYSFVHPLWKKNVLMRNMLRRSDLMDEIHGKSISDERFIVTCVAYDAPRVSDVAEVAHRLKSIILTQHKALEHQSINGVRILSAMRDSWGIQADPRFAEDWMWSVADVVATRTEAVIEQVLGLLGILENKFSSYLFCLETE